MKASTEHDYRRRVARVIDAIMADPPAAHSVESLAAIARFSPFHFHRIYGALTGERLAATIRRARLARAALQLTGAPVTVTDAAFEAGYDSAQSFARAFRGLTGLSPSGFKARQQALSAAGASVAIVERPPVTAFGLCHDGPAATIPHCHRRLRVQAARHGLDWRRVPRIGIASGNPEHAERFCYFAGLALPDSVASLAGLEPHTLPGGLYAAYRLTGPSALIAPTVQALFGGWLPQSGFVPDDRPLLELYGATPAAAGPGVMVADLLIPIREVTP